MNIVKLSLKRNPIQISTCTKLNIISNNTGSQMQYCKIYLIAGKCVRASLGFGSTSDWIPIPQHSQAKPKKMYYIFDTQNKLTSTKTHNLFQCH